MTRTTPATIRVRQHFPLDEQPHAQNLRTAVLLLALPAAFTASAQAADLIGSTSLWPTEGQWKALSGISDPAQTGLDGRLDLVGGGTTPVAYWMSDATGVYFRVRINAPEVTVATAPPGTLLVMIDLLGDGDTGPEYAFSWDAINASKPNSHGLELTAISPPSGQQGVVGTTWATTNFEDWDGNGGTKGRIDINGGGRADGFLRSVAATDGLGSFVDFKVTWSYLTQISGTGLAPGQSWNVNFATIAGNDHARINADVIGALANNPVSSTSWSTIVVAVPEPAHYGLAGAGIAALTTFLKRRRR